ncbi:MAG: tRNA lysidine(34) synthetase TilS, partial [Saprospiraceae bacterium]|nr:tRNA lysidine(34) synthetase TilS [Saprospiraceae bacterium]
AMLYAGLHAFGFSRKQCREVIKALASVGAQIQSSSHILTIDRTHIYIDPISKAKSIIAFDYKDVQQLSFGQYEFTFKVCTQAAHLKEKNFAYFPIHKLNSTLTLRHWQDGDSFKPYGLDAHSQTLKKYFTDQKIDLRSKQDIPLLLNGHDIIWVVHYRTHHDYAINPDEGPFLEVHCEKVNG